MRKAHLGRVSLPMLAVLALVAGCGDDDDDEVGNLAPTVTQAAAASAATGAATASANDTTAATANGPSGSAVLAEPVSITVARAPAMPQLPLFIAESEGIFERNGLDVEFVAVASGPEMAAAQIGGDITFADNVASNLLPLIDQDLDLVAFAEVLTSSQFDIIVGSHVTVPPGGSWQAVMEALEGQRVGVVARGAGAEDVARTLFTEAGVNPDAQTYIATGGPPTTLAAMGNGEIDMAITFEPGITLGVEQGVAQQPFSIRAGEGPDSLQFPGVVTTAFRDYAEENPDVLEAYVASVDEALAFVKDPANQEAVLEVITSQLGVPPETAPVLLDANIEYFPSGARLEPDRLQVAAQWVFDLGKTTELLDPRDFVLTVEAG